jgi:hypothetical protein
VERHPNTSSIPTDGRPAVDHRYFRGLRTAPKKVTPLLRVVDREEEPIDAELRGINVVQEPPMTAAASLPFLACSLTSLGHRTRAPNDATERRA